MVVKVDTKLASVSDVQRIGGISSGMRQACAKH